jgi:hypothetical protein
MSDVPFLVFSYQASRTGDLLRGEVLRAVYGNGIAAAKNLVLLDVFASLQGTEEVVKKRRDLFRIDLVERVFASWRLSATRRKRFESISLKQEGPRCFFACTKKP